jgi:hypothetical protein
MASQRESAVNIVEGVTRRAWHEYGGSVVASRKQVDEAAARYALHSLASIPEMTYALPRADQRPAPAPEPSPTPPSAEVVRNMVGMTATEADAVLQRELENAGQTDTPAEQLEAAVPANPALLADARQEINAAYGDN